MWLKTTTDFPIFSVSCIGSLGYCCFRPKFIELGYKWNHLHWQAMILLVLQELIFYRDKWRWKPAWTFGIQSVWVSFPFLKFGLKKKGFGFKNSALEAAEDPSHSFEDDMKLHVGSLSFKLWWKCWTQVFET